MLFTIAIFINYVERLTVIMVSSRACWTIGLLVFAVFLANNHSFFFSSSVGCDEKEA